MVKMKWQLHDILGLSLGESNKVPWDTMQVTAILVKQDGNVYIDRSTHKDELISKIGKGDLLLAAWNGQYRTDIFAMDIKDIKS
jgi:hypothetical protein